MTIKIALLAVYICSFSLGSAYSAASSCQQEKPAALQAERVSATDKAVMDVVLQHLLDRFRPSALGVDVGGPQPTLVFLTQPPGWEPMRIQPSGAPPGPGWFPLDYVTADMVDSLTSRNKIEPRSTDASSEESSDVPSLWDHYRPLADQHTKMAIFAGAYRDPEVLKKIRKQVPRATHFIAAYRPGYSRDGKTTIVEIGIGPRPERLAFFVLKKQGKRWVLRDKYIWNGFMG